nr:thyroxine 5-deiodinase-like [Cherax quadricarinatus]
MSLSPIFCAPVYVISHTSPCLWRSLYLRTLSTVVPCVSKVLGRDRVREMVLARQDPLLSQNSKDRLLTTIDGSLEFANAREKSKAIWEGTMREVNMVAEMGGQAPNPVMLRHQGRTQCHLLSGANPGKPLVINFGSSTCPVFMANLEKFRELTEEFCEVADFVLVYTAEAHPSDGWALRDNIKVAKHRTLDERYLAAQKMLKLEPVKCPVMLDRLDDEANKAYGALPERLYIILDGVIVYMGQQGPVGYKVSEVEFWLDDYRSQLS